MIIESVFIIGRNIILESTKFHNIFPTKVLKSLFEIKRQYMVSSNGYNVVAGMGGGGGAESTWANPNELGWHYDKHGKQFDSPNSKDYARKAQELYKNRMKYQRKTDSEGVTRVYDSETNSFGSYNAQGKTITFFKPSQGQRYFDRQKGE